MGRNSSKPTTAQVIGGVYDAVPPVLNDGDASSLELDSSGNLKVNVVVGGGGGTTGNVNLIQVGGVAISEGQKTMAASLPVVIASDQSTVPVTITGNPAITGLKTNNAVVPDGNNLGVLPAVANAATQTWTEGDQVLESVDLSGRQRICGTLTNNNAAPAADGTMALSALANAAAPSWTEGQLVLESVDLAGNHRVIGTKTNNSAPPSTQLGVLPALANAANPTWTEGDQVLASVTLTGAQRVTNLPVTQGGTLTATGTIGATATAVKASAGQIYGWYIFNNNVGFVYCQIFDLATGSVTLGTTAPKLSFGIPAGSAANVLNAMGIAFSTAISIAFTTTRSGLTGPANTVDYNFMYF
jgi:hypothetical protein